MDEEMNLEEGLTDFTPLIERAVRRDGTIPIKLISPGWGSSGYYAPDVLERDGPKIFTPGLKMFWNHPTATEEAERPEGDLNALAAELASPARWEANGHRGPGLYADAKVFENYRKPIDELAQHIGVSIRGLGLAKQGEAEGKTGPIIQEMRVARSVDFVTEPGAGGEIISIFEAARKAPVETKPREVEMADEKLATQLQESEKRLSALETENARLREAIILHEAETFVARQLADVSLPDVTKTRIAAQLKVNPPTKEGALDRDALAARIDEAAQSEAAYLASVGAGQVSGLGAHPSPLTEASDAVTERMKAGFAALGLRGREIEQAVTGRF